MQTINHPLLSDTRISGSSRAYATELVYAARQKKNKKLKGWRVESYTAANGAQRARIYHFGTCMIDVNALDPTDNLMVDLGWGSVSDQAGMNAIFDSLGLNLFYSRAGGASIELHDSLTNELINVA